LESEAGWVEMYGITGELVVPEILNQDSEVDSLLKDARKVSVDLLFINNLPEFSYRD